MFTLKIVIATVNPFLVLAVYKMTLFFLAVLRLNTDIQINFR